MKKYVDHINENNQDGSFLRAVLAVREDRYKDAYDYIEKVSVKKFKIFRSLVVSTGFSGFLLGILD